jgi:hypothetical protein
MRKRLTATRSASSRDDVQGPLTKADNQELEERHRQGYERFPVKAGEFDPWEQEQVWVE